MRFSGEASSGLLSLPCNASVNSSMATVSSTARERPSDFRSCTECYLLVILVPAWQFVRTDTVPYFRLCGREKWGRKTCIYVTGQPQRSTFLHQVLNRMSRLPRLSGLIGRISAVARRLHGVGRRYRKRHRNLNDQQRDDAISRSTSPTQQSDVDTQGQPQTPTLVERIHALPPELFNMIYAEWCNCRDVRIPEDANIHATAQFNRIPKILQIDQVLRHKYLEDYFFLNRFIFRDLATCQRWIGTFSEHVPDLDNSAWKCQKCATSCKTWKNEFVKDGCNWGRRLEFDPRKPDCEIPNVMMMVRWEKT